MKKILAGIMALCALVFVSQTLFSADILVADYALCTAIEEREPVNKNTSFSKDVEKIYFWNLIKTQDLPTTIKHVWYYGQEQKAEVPLEIKYPRHRTYSCKTILPEWQGNWSVEVVDSEGNVLKKVSFTVGGKSQTSENEAEEPEMSSDQDE